MPKRKMSPPDKARHVWRWAMTMTKVAIRQAVSHKPWPRWHFIEFRGKHGGEARGIVDMIAIRKDHSERTARRFRAKRGDPLQIVFLQVKGGYAAKPTPDDARRLQIVARQHNACAVLLSTWKKGRCAQFYSLDTRNEWVEVTDLRKIFC